MKKILSLLLVATAFGTSAFAQPLNDDCSNPYQLADLSNWCSGAGQFSNQTATPSGFAATTCGGSFANDTWFYFTAQALDVTITVSGIGQPAIGLYTGSCGGGTAQVNEIVCRISSGNAVDLYKGGLIPGQTYLVRVGSGVSGAFQLCINNYNQPAAAGSDCVTASLLCDKQPFTIQSVSGAGNDNDEAKNSCLGSSTVSSESNSTWYKWTCGQPGTLTFTLTPNVNSDDLDFVVFELNNGINSCNKTIIRCEGSGESQPGQCIGPTGLSLSATDLTEQAGCDNGQDNFVRYLDMQVGKSYALMINNFSSAGNGFRIEWGGTGAFAGPDAAFSASPQNICLGRTVQVTDNAQAGIGTIAAETWAFGAGATPPSATGSGPFTVSYSSIGAKPIVHIVRSSVGCTVAKTLIINVDTLAVTASTTNPTCGGGQDGTARVVVNRGIAPYVYSWSNGNTTQLIVNVPQGNYTVTVNDASGQCTQQRTVFVRELILIAAQGVAANPRCFGAASGAINMVITNGQPPYSFDFGNTGTFGASQNFPNLAAGTYTVSARDGNTCTTPFTFTLTDPPVLAAATEGFAPLRCYGYSDGKGNAAATGGTPPYIYVWSNGQTTDTLKNVAIGVYTCTITDANNCSTTVTATLTQPTPFTVAQLTATPSPCYQLPFGKIQARGNGGVMPYQYSADCNVYQTDSLLVSLIAGTYTVCIKDGNSCTTTGTTTITQPLPVAVNAGKDTTITLGFTLSLNATMSPFGYPITNYQWSPVGVQTPCANCPRIDVQPADDTRYTISATDDKGCTYTDDVLIKVEKKRPIYFPTAFSPNGDGKNDFFNGFGNAGARFVRSLKVFDRWGVLVYDGKDLPINDEKNGWDGTFKGKLMNPAVFVYLAEVEFIDGFRENFKGDVSLVW